MPALTFRPLTESDLPMLHEWLQRPHVAEWWDDRTTLEELRATYLPCITGADTTTLFVCVVDGEPAGLIQVYVVKDSPDGWWEGETDPGARGIDIFIARADLLGQGLGSAILRTFVHGLFRDSAVTTVQADPSLENARAIRSYRRAGFVTVGEVVTPDGRALLMRCDRESLSNSGS